VSDTTHRPGLELVGGKAQPVSLPAALHLAVLQESLTRARLLLNLDDASIRRKFLLASIQECVGQLDEELARGEI
jgi:hypothetical protein